MDQQKKEKIRQEVRKEFRLGRARLFRVEVEEKIRAEIAEDRSRLFVAFKQLGPPEKELELDELQQNGFVSWGAGGLQVLPDRTRAWRLGEDRARFYLMEYLQTHPKTGNAELVRYLDRKNGRLAELKTCKESPLWAPLRPSWEQRCRKKNIPLIEGECWETAFKEFPKILMPYLSRARDMAQEPRFKNVLFTWPRIVHEHKKRRQKPAVTPPEA